MQHLAFFVPRLTGFNEGHNRTKKCFIIFPLPLYNILKKKFLRFCIDEVNHYVLLFHYYLLLAEIILIKFHFVIEIVNLFIPVIFYRMWVS